MTLSKEQIAEIRRTAKFYSTRSKGDPRDDVADDFDPL